MTTHVNRALGMLLAAILGLVSTPLTAATTYTTINPPDASTGNEDDTSIPVAIDGQNMIGAYFASDGSASVSGFYYNATSKALININPPGSMATYPQAILGNNAVGYYTDSNSVDQGFLYNLTTQAYTTISPPSATYTECLGLSAQSVVGTYADSANVRHGFLYNLSAQTFTTIDPPGTVMTQGVAVSGSDVVGYYFDSNNVAHGFLDNGGAFTVIDPPGTASTYITSMSGNIVAGYYEDSANASHGFLYNLTTQAYTTIDPPGTATTYIYAISGTEVVGSYDDSSYTSHGFVYDLSAQAYTTLDPAGSTFTECHGVSNGLVAGQYEDKSYNPHYFIASLGVTSSGTGTSTPTAKVTLGSLTATYNGASHVVTVTTSPAGLSTSVTYNGSPNPPTNAGSYPIVATVTASGYTGFATGTLVIAQAKATVALSALTAAYNGSQQGVTATTNPPGLGITITYAGDSAEPLAAGKYAVVATITDPNYAGSASGTFTIAPGTATVTLGSLSATYDGTAHAVTAMTAPPNLTVNFTYNGSATAPTAAGSYKVVGTVSSTDYTGSGTGTLVIAKALADVTLTPSSLSATYTGNAIAVAATSNPTATITYTYMQNGKTASPINAGTYDVTATVNTANAAGSATGTLTIGPASATVTLGGLTQVYSGKPISATATTVPAKLAVGFTYNGSSSAPTVTGSYTVVGTITNPNYTGSATETLTITPVPPTATTGSATRFAAEDATISGTVNPNGTVTSAHFLYYYVGSSGTVTATTTNFSLGGGTAGVTIAAPISGLVPSTLYHFQIIANNGISTVAGAVKTFTTLAVPTFSPPSPAAQAPAPQLSASGVLVSFSVDPNGVATTVQFKYGTDANALNSLTASVSLGSGKTAVVTSAFLSGLAANTTYYFEVVATSGGDTYTSSVESFTTLSFDTTLVASTGTLAPGTSWDWSALDSSTVNAADGAAFRATLSGAAAASNTGIWANVANGGSLALLAQTGSSASNINGGVFSALTDPTYNNNGDVAFGGTLKVVTGTVTAATENGVWATNGGTLALLAREGSVAPGTGGALFATFTGTGISDNGGTILAGTLTSSTTLGVTATNNAGVWEGTTAGNLTLMLRTGETTSTTAGTKTIAAFKLFPVETYVGGQTRAFAPTTGDFAATATYTDKTSGIIDVTTSAPEAPAAVATVGDVAADTIGATFATFGSPAIDDNDEVAFYATLKAGVGDATTKNDSGIWASYDGGTPMLIARLGSIAPGTGTIATFLTFSDPVENANDAVAFRATLSVGTGAATSTSNTGIWCDSTGLLALVAQTGEQAPGCALGVKISALTELALDDVNGATQQGGVMFLATLSGTGVTATNNTAIFAQDDTGTLQLIVRTGDVLNEKTITALTFLPAELATGNSPVNGQGRSFSGSTGDLVYNATFSDKSQAIFNVVFQPPIP